MTLSKYGDHSTSPPFTIHDGSPSTQELIRSWDAGRWEVNLFQTGDETLSCSVTELVSGKIWKDIMISNSEFHHPSLLAQRISWARSQHTASVILENDQPASVLFKNTFSLQRKETSAPSGLLGMLEKTLKSDPNMNSLAKEAVDCIRGIQELRTDPFIVAGPHGPEEYEPDQCTVSDLMGEAAKMKSQVIDGKRIDLCYCGFGGSIRRYRNGIAYASVYLEKYKDQAEADYKLLLNRFPNLHPGREPNYSKCVSPGWGRNLPSLKERRELQNKAMDEAVIKLQQKAKEWGFECVRRPSFDELKGIDLDLLALFDGIHFIYRRIGESQQTASDVPASGLADADNITSMIIEEAAKAPPEESYVQMAKNGISSFFHSLGAKQ